MYVSNDEYMSRNRQNGVRHSTTQERVELKHFEKMARNAS